jgi:hypothetical protein
VAIGKVKQTCVFQGGCRNDYPNAVRYRRTFLDDLFGTELDDSFYWRETGYGLRYRLDLGQLLGWPGRGTLQGVLSVGKGDWLLVEFYERDGAPHLRILAGCLRDEAHHISRRGRERGDACADVVADPRNPNNNFYSRAAGFSYHGGYWIDYRSGQVHEAPVYPFEAHELEKVVGLTADRNAVLLVYRELGERAQAEHRFLLCAAGIPARRTEEACISFTRDDAPAPEIIPVLRRDAVKASPPLPAIAFEPYDLDADSVSADWRAWLAQRFDLTALGRDGRPVPRVRG